MLQPSAYTEFRKENVDEDCCFKFFRSYYSGTDLEQDDIEAQKTAGILRAEVHDLAAHRTGDSK